MATFTFDGTSSVTATKNDTVIINADPTTFTQVTETTVNGAGAVVLSFGNTSITVTGTSFTAGGLPNVYVNNGTFDYLTSANPLGTNNNVLSIFGSNTAPAGAAITSVAGSKVAVFGGTGINDTADNGDTITTNASFSTKGSLLIHGSGGIDTITQPAAFDSTVVANVYGDQGGDGITLSQANAKASIFISGGADSDTIAVTNTGSTTIVGGLGFSDSTDSADTISFAGNGGTFNVYGNAGADTISSSATLDSAAVANVYGGTGNDTVTLVGTGGSKLFIVGGEGSDSITVDSTGATGAVTIYGGIGATDPNDAGDVITLGAAQNNAATIGGTWNVFGNGGADNISNGTNISFDSTSTVNIYGGTGADTVNITGVTGAKLFVSGGEAGDDITVTTGGAATTVYGGISSSDTTDAADTITVAGTGTINVFSNAGDDSVSLTTANTNVTTTVATVYGGAGNDTIAIGAQTGVAAGTAQGSINVYGNDGADTFQITKGTGIGVTVQDFTVAQADKLQVLLSNGTIGAAVVNAGSFSLMDQALAAASAAASTAASKAAVASAGGSTYLVLGDANAAYSQTADQVIKLTGVTDASTVIQSITIVS